MKRGLDLRILMAVILATLTGCSAEVSAGAQPGAYDESADAPPTWLAGGSELAPLPDGGTDFAAPSAPSSGAPSSGEPAEGASTTPSLGALPSELGSLAWPTRPNVTREVSVTTAAELQEAAATPGTRVLANGVHGGDVRITANDVEIVADPGTSLGQLSIGQGVQRVRVEGGRWTAVRIDVPADFSAGASYRPELMAQDVWLEGMTVESGSETAYEIRGERIAIVGSDVTAGRYSVWCGDTGDFQTEDLILYDNVFRSAGPEATVRLVSVLRSATVSNVLSNTFKHNYRIHGVSDLNFAADNLLVGTGVMLGTMEGDSLGTVWFDDNVMHHDAPDLFNPSPSIAALFARRNMVYAAQHTSFYGGAAPSGWTVAENQMAAYQEPPSF